MSEIKYRDYRTSLICKLFHRVKDQIMRVVGDTPYPNICYRCEPDYFMEQEIVHVTVCDCWKNFGQNGRHDVENCKCNCHFTEGVERS